MTVQTDLCQTWSEILKTGFIASRLMSKQHCKFNFMFLSKCDLHISMQGICANSVLSGSYFAFNFSFISLPLYFEYLLQRVKVVVTAVLKYRKHL